MSASSLTCSRGLVRAVESSVSARRRADVHVEEDAVSQSEDAAVAFIWYEDGSFLAVCWLTSEGREDGKSNVRQRNKRLLTKYVKLNILRKGNVQYQEVLQDRTWAAAPAEHTGIEPAPSGWRLRRGSRWASRRGRSCCPSPDTLSLWPETQPGLIWGQVLEEDNKSQSVLKKTNENKHLKQLILWWNKTFNTTAFRSDAWFDSQSGKTRHFPLRSSASPSRHNQDVNGLRRADEKCMCLRSERCKCVDGRTITPEL